VFRATLAAGGVKPIQLPARSPNLNAFAQRWIRCAKQECLSKLILFGEASLRRALDEFVEFVEHLSYKTESPGLKAALCCFLTMSIQANTFSIPSDRWLGRTATREGVL
jgi:hypothetical protein